MTKPKEFYIRDWREGTVQKDVHYWDTVVSDIGYDPDDKENSSDFEDALHVVEYKAYAELKLKYSLISNLIYEASLMSIGMPIDSFVMKIANIKDLV